MIGIFDSGLGGLTVVREVFRQLPECQIIYLGDTARTPYGSKSPETITRYAVEDVEFLIKHGANLIIAACNTVSAVAMDSLRKKFPNVPIFDVVEPAVARAAEVSRCGRIGVIGTRATISSLIYTKKINALRKDAIVEGKACPLLVSLVEEGWAEEGETARIIKRYVAGLKSHSIDTLILGCTHYPLLRDRIQYAIGRKVHLVDPATEVASEVKKYLSDHPEIEKSLTRGETHQFFVTDSTPHFQGVASSWLGYPIGLQLAKL